MANMASACALVVSDEKSFSPVRSWSTKTAATTCLFVSVSVVSICVMVVCGVFIVREYVLAESYKKTNCWVEKIVITNKTCTYCPGHKSKEKNSPSCFQSTFPCAQVLVAYETDGTKKAGLLRYDSIEASGAFSQCSFHVCNKEQEDNINAVQQYLLKYRTLKVKYIESTADDTNEKSSFLSGSNNTNHNINNYINSNNNNNNVSHVHNSEHGFFVCYYNEDDSYDVIEYKNYTKSDVIHCMFWPALVVLVCCCAFLYIEANRRGLTFCGSKEQNPPHQGTKLRCSRKRFLPTGRIKVNERGHFTSNEFDTTKNNMKHKSSGTETFLRNNGQGPAKGPVECRSLLSNEPSNDHARTNRNHGDANACRSCAVKRGCHDDEKIDGVQGRGRSEEKKSGNGRSKVKNDDVTNIAEDHVVLQVNQ